MATLKQSTAYTRMFLLVQSSDHLTGLTGATPAVTLSKAGGAFGAAGGTVTEVSSGWYKIALTTTDTNTLGDLAFHITATSGDATDFSDQITANILGDTLPANLTQVNAHSVTDTANGVLDVNAKNIGGTAQTGRDLGLSVLLSNGTGTGQISLSTGKVTVGTNSDKTGYTASTVSDKTGYSISGTKTTLDALNDISVSSILTTQMSESYAANGTAPTLAQSLFALHQMLMEFSISGTTITVKKLDNATTAFSVTLDDATNPTSAHR